MRSAYWTRVGSIWRERKTSVLFVAYLLIGLPLSGELAYGSLYFLLLGLFLLLLYVVEKWKGPRVWMMVALALLVLLFDNVLIRDLNAWLQFRYIFLLLAAVFLVFRPALWRGVRYFLLLNLLYVVVFYWNAGRLKEVKLYPGKEKGLVRKQIDQWVGEKKDIVVIMLDGYPAERILKDSFGLRGSIREVYPFLSYRENRSVYLESPLSVTHQLFSIRTDRTRDVLGENSDVFRLFADARRLAAWDHNLEGYEQHWISYFNDKDVYNSYLLPFWRPDPFRAFIRLLLWKKLHALISLRKVTGYNNWVLDQLTLVPEVKTKPRFLFLYFLTFHNAGYSVQQDVADSERYLEQALKQLKGAYQLIIFSDHGIRYDAFSRQDQSSGIYYSGRKAPEFRNVSFHVSFPYLRAMPSFSLIGAAGYIAPRHLQALHRQGCSLLSAYDPQDATDQVKRYFPEARIFTSFEAFNEDFLRTPSEWVSICSPNHLHRTQIEWGLRQGVKVICEKPLVTEPSELEELARLELLTGGRVFTVLQLRLLEEVQRLKALVEAAGKQDFEVDIEHVAPRSAAYFASWKGDPALSGGIVTNIGIHLFDLLLWVFGPVREIVELALQERKAGGVLQLEKARVRWRLSVDERDLPPGSSGFYRRLTVDDRVVSLEQGLEGLHDRFYAAALGGVAPGIAEARPSIELCKQLAG